MDLVKQVKKYVEDHYNEDNLDIIYETFEDSELADLIKDCATFEAAIAEVKSTAALQAEVCYGRGMTPDW